MQVYHILSSCQTSQDLRPANGLWQGGYIHITNYYTNEFEPGQQIDADVYILCYEESLSDLLGHIDDFTKVVVMKRNIKQQYLQPVIDLPAGTSVLVVNDSREGILIGEGILKRHLAELKQDGLIFSGSGRSGSRITEKGKELLKNKE